MYKEIIKVMDSVIEHHKSLKDTNMTDRDRHYFIQGLEVAKQQIEQLEEYHTGELAYEIFEVTVKALKDSLNKYDMWDIIEDVMPIE